MSANDNATDTDTASVRGEDHRSLHRIAARLLYDKKFEEDGTNEVSDITFKIFNIVYVRNVISIIVFMFSLFLLVTSIGIWIVAFFHGLRASYLVSIYFFIMNGILFLFMMSPLIYWRRLQYGSLSGGQRRQAIYGPTDKQTQDTLEKLFEYLSQRTAPKAFYRGCTGRKRYLNRSYFGSALRGLLLSDNSDHRALVLPLTDFWCRRPIILEAEPEDVIQALKVKPRSDGGRPRKYPYEDILLSIIEHPLLQTLVKGVYGTENTLMKLIRDQCEPREGHDRDIPLPEESSLRQFAKKILDAIEKNRAERSVPGR